MMKRRGAPRLLLALAALAAIVAGVVTVVGPAQKARALSPAIGWLDSWTQLGPGYIRLTGWAATADAPWAALGVRAKVDGVTVTDWYYLAGVYRPDVGAYLGPAYGAYHGYVIDVAVPTADDGLWGGHTVCVEAQNSGYYNNLSGCLLYGMTSGAFFGGRWSQNPGSLLKVGYHVVSTNYPGQVAAAVNNYNATYSAVSMSAVARPNSLIDIFNEYKYSGNSPGVLGYTDFYGSCVPPGEAPAPVGCHQYWTDVTVYDYAMTSYSMNYARQTQVFIHEIGHALGLTHAYDLGPSSVMKAFIDNASMTLTNYDLINIGRLYPF